MERIFSQGKKRGASSTRGKANRGAVGLKTTPTLSSQARGDGCGELLSITPYEGLQCGSPAVSGRGGRRGILREALDHSPECTELPVLHLGAAVGTMRKA